MVDLHPVAFDNPLVFQLLDPRGGGRAGQMYPFSQFFHRDPAVEAQFFDNAFIGLIHKQSPFKNKVNRVKRFIQAVYSNPLSSID